MALRLLNRMRMHGDSRFVREAVDRGLSLGIARLLDEAARRHAPEAPVSILESREAFQTVAMEAVVGDAGNLELSFDLVDRLATAVEQLGLGRSSDTPDPFRRVWVATRPNAEDERSRGVVFTHRESVISVFCPVSRETVWEIGATLHLQYRGIDSVVSYGLQLNDAVRLPEAQVLHMTRKEGQGAIGRSSKRFEVDEPGTVRSLAAGAGGATPCRVLDVSTGGLSFETTEASFEVGQLLRVEAPLEGAGEPRWWAAAIVRRAPDPVAGTQRVSVQFQGVEGERETQLAGYIARLEAASDAA